MKNILYIIMAIAASALFFSCEEQQPTGEKYAAAPEVEIVTKDDVFAADQGILVVFRRRSGFGFPGGLLKNDTR